MSLGHARTCVLALVLSLGPVSALAAQHGSPDRDRRSASLTQDLAELGARFEGAGPEDRPELLRAILARASARRRLLESAIDADPALVMRVALPAAMRAKLPAVVWTDLEEHVELDGALEVLAEDHAWGARVRRYLRTAAGRLQLHVAGHAPALQTGQRVRVRGVRLGDALALDAADVTPAAALAVLPNTTGEQRTLVLLVNFADDPSQPYTAAHAHQVVFSTASDYDREASFERTWLTGDVHGWFTLPLSGSLCDPYALATLAQQAAGAAGVNLGAYSRYVYAFPENACAWWGLGTIGGAPSQAWINGDFVLDVVAHEMGHNLGLYHAHSLDCGASPVAPPCTASEYGDTLDMMGGARGHFSAAMKERLGWLGAAGTPAIATASTSGVYAIEPFESPSAGGAKALRILKSVDAATGARTWYYVELRRPIGFDSFLSGSTNVPNGVVVRTAAEASANAHYLLDMTPETASWYDPALVSARTFADPAAGLSLTTVSADDTGASVSVMLSGPVCTRGAPAVSLSPSQSQWLPPGGTATYTVSVRNTDAAECPASGFDLTALAPAGWTAGLGLASVSIAPGATASTAMQVVSPAGTANGFYTAQATATHAADASKAGSASATYVVMSALGVQVMSARASYTRNQNVQITAMVSAGSSAASGAAVVFTVTRPTGAVTRWTSTAAANGVATYSWRVGAKDPAGTYRVDVSASLNGATGAGATSFLVTR
jgi:hypothetical protein